MGAFVVNNQVWRVLPVHPQDPGLIDGYGIQRIAVADPATRTIRISATIPQQMLDQVVLHEVAHAVAMEYGLEDQLAMLGEIGILSEWVAQFSEIHAIEIADLASRAIGRPICIKSLCYNSA